MRDDAAPRQAVLAAPRIAQGLVRESFRLALISVIVQLPLWLFLAFAGAAVAIAPVVLFAHLAFVVALTDFGMNLAADPDATLSDSYTTGMAGGLVLMIPALALVVGALAAPSSLRWSLDIPWLQASWLVVALFAVPARLAARLRRKPVAMRPLWHRLPVVAAFAIPVALVPIAMPTPGGECCGLFEGGLVILPAMLAWTGAYLLVACVSLAFVSAVSVRLPG